MVESQISNPWLPPKSPLQHDEKDDKEWFLHPFALQSSYSITFPPLVSRNDRKAKENSDAWSNLIPDLISRITHLLLPSEHVRARSVCTSWSSALKENPSSFAPHFPWLALIPSGETNDILSLLSIPEKRSYRVPIPLSNHYPFVRNWEDPDYGLFRCVGSRDGWLVMSYSNRKVEILNPLARARIGLPSITTIHRNRVRDTFHYDCYCKIKKIVLSSHVSTSEGFVALLVYKGDNLAFTRAGDTVWTKLYFSRNKGRISDAIYHKGRFFVIYERGHLRALNLTGPFLKGSTFKGSEDGITDIRRYLVASSSCGSLFQVMKKVDSEFVVLKFDPTIDSCWFEAKDLYDLSFFLDDKHSMALYARDIPQMKGNCIYYTYNDGHCTCYDQCDRHYQTNNYVEVFDIEEGNSTPYFHTNFQIKSKISFPLIWFVPSLR